MIPQNEVQYLRELAKKFKETCMTSENEEKRQAWYKINDLKENARPVFINHYWPTALNELFPQNEYYCQSQEGKFYENYFQTRFLYSQELKDDNVMEPIIYSKNEFTLEDYSGFATKIARSMNDHGGTGAYEMIPVLIEESDIDKIKSPILNHDVKKSRENFDMTREIFGDILTVIKEPHTMAAKIADEYSWLRGMESTYLDMYDDPEWMHEALRRIKDNFIERFKLLEEAGIWGCLDSSDPLGSAGLRYATGIKDYRDVIAEKGENADFFNEKVKLNESWGFTCAEVFNCVSCDMHREFSYDYDKEAMDLFKYVNVGCCEVLDKKVDLAKVFENGRKYSVSEWCGYETAAAALKRDWVYSYRAAGVPFVNPQWDKVSAEKEIRGVLEATKKYGCNTEIVLNIGGTLGENPRQKVIEWSAMTRKLINEYFG